MNRLDSWTVWTHEQSELMKSLNSWTVWTHEQSELINSLDSKLTRVQLVHFATYIFSSLLNWCLVKFSGKWNCSVILGENKIAQELETKKNSHLLQLRWSKDRQLQAAPGSQHCCLEIGWPRGQEWGHGRGWRSPEAGLPAQTSRYF